MRDLDFGKELIRKKIKEGNKAPDFTALDQNGKKVKLSSFKGKKNVILYFYPKDNTPGCTLETKGQVAST